MFEEQERDYTQAEGPIENFSTNSGGGTALRVALMFGAAGIALSVLAAPFMQTAAQKIAGAPDYGVDTMTTGSIKTGKRYILRKSVLNPKQTRICRGNQVC